MNAVIHIAGLDVTVNDRYLRQRCAWCGATLINYDLTRVAVPVGQDPRPGTWPVGDLIAVDGPMSYGVLLDGGRLPEGCCALVDPAVTA